MIVSTTATIGIQCSRCGELQFSTLSVFALSRFNKESTCCACGAPLMTLTSFEGGTYGIEFPCIYCGITHYLLLKRDLIWGGNVFQLTCSDKKLPIGYIGPEQQVINSCEEIKKKFIQFVSQLVDDEEIESEFDSFFVVYAVMEKLGKMAESRTLGCSCGNNNLSVEILPDKIELICETCGATGIIYTDNKEILHIIDNAREIFLEENMTWFLNDLYKGHDLVKNK